MSGAVSRNDVPRRLGRERIQDLPLTPVEGYVLSQIDDHTAVADLGLVVGLPAEELDRILCRLADLGLIQLGATQPLAPGGPPGRPRGEKPEAATSAAAASLPNPPRDSPHQGGGPDGPGAASSPARSPAVRPAVAPPPPRPSSRPPTSDRPPGPPPRGRPSSSEPPRAAGTASADVKPPSADPSSAAGEWGVLTPEERRRIETFLVRAESSDFYKLLGVSRRADRAEIRSAYFGLAKEFHPDAYYGREIGEARHRLERIFRQITRAYEVLSRTKSRREYDEYLKGQAVLHGQEEEEQAWQQEEERRQTPYGAKATSAARDAARARAEAAEAAETEESGAAPADAIPAETSPAETSPAEASPVEATAGAPSGGKPPEAPAGTGPGPAPDWKVEPPPPAGKTLPVAGTPPPARETPPPAAGASPPVARSSAAENWRRLRMAKQLAAMLRRPHAEPPRSEKRGSDYLADAEAAAKDAEWGRVFGLLEAAEKLGLSEAEQGRLAELRERSSRELARISFNQAKFSESTGDLAGALEHVERACRYGTDNAECWDAAARLGLRLGRELHRARDAALKAIQLAPQTIGYRITLIRVYLAAGLVKNARREAEAALAIKPDDKQVKALLAEARAQHE